MSQAEAEALVMSVLQEIQTKCGLEEITPTHDTCPLLDMPGFDSLLALEACVELEAKVGVCTEENHFIGDDDQPRTVEGIAASLRSALEGEHVEQH